MATLLVLPTSLGDWLLELGLFDHTELDSPPVDGYVLRREASQEFENGVRVLLESEASRDRSQRELRRELDELRMQAARDRDAMEAVMRLAQRPRSAGEV